MCYAIIPVLIALLLPVVGFTQSAVPLVTSYGGLVVFQDGRFHEAEARKPQAVFPCGDRVAYLTDAGDLKLYDDGRVTTLQGGEQVRVGTSKHALAWRSGPSLRIPMGDGAKTICRSVGRYTVTDSIVAFHDQMQQTFSVYWNGRVVPVADVLMSSEDVVWKSGPNTLLLYDLGHSRVLLFYRGRTSVLCNGTDLARSEPGGDMVAYMDEYDDTFRVFSEGLDYDVDPFAPESFQVGSGLVAYVTNTGEFRCFKDGRVWNIADYAPDEYWVRDSMVVFRDRNDFKVFHGGGVETLARTMPTQWDAVGGMVAWLDVSGVLNLYRAGQQLTVSREAGLDHFELYPGAVRYVSRSGDTKIWWNGKLYEHY